MGESSDIVSLVGGLFHRLAHDLRTPLAVISNELHYLATLVPKGECDRAAARCRDIDAELATLSFFPRTPFQPTALSLAELAKALEQLGLVVELSPLDLGSSPSADTPPTRLVDPVWLAGFIRLASRALCLSVEREGSVRTLLCQLKADRISVSLTDEQRAKVAEGGAEDAMKDRPVDTLLQILASAMQREVCYSPHRVELML